MSDHDPESFRDGVRTWLGVEELRSLVYAAAAAVDAGSDEAELLARMAKAMANDAFAASRGVQLHGGFGFTIDCDVHLTFKRVLASRPALGETPHPCRWISERLISAIGDV